MADSHFIGLMEVSRKTITFCYYLRFSPYQENIDLHGSMTSPSFYPSFNSCLFCFFSSCLLSSFIDCIIKLNLSFSFSFLLLLKWSFQTHNHTTLSTCDFAFTASFIFKSRTKKNVSESVCILLHVVSSDWKGTSEIVVVIFLLFSFKPADHETDELCPYYGEGKV